MYTKSTRPSAKREVQKERRAKRDDQIARPNLRAKRAARDVTVPVMWADFFYCNAMWLLSKTKVHIYVSFSVKEIISKKNF